MIFPSVSCDWLTVSHRLDCDQQIKQLSSGRTLKLDRDGVIDWESLDWEKLYCPSSDTSLRIRCDGHKLQMTGNVSRWKQENNMLGLTVIECIEVWAQLLPSLGIHVPLFGTRSGHGTIGESGTALTRVDLAGNLETDNYNGLCQCAMNNRIGRTAPRVGKYGPTWGYDTKRGNWVKSKLYDKTAEIEGRRTPATGATVARYEVQLGSEYLKREGLDLVSGWKGGGEMERVIHGRFADQAFREQATVNSWDDIPVRLRGIAYAWRDGVCLRNEMHPRTFQRNRKILLDYGIDIAVECNVIALTAKIREVQITPIHALRRAA